MYNTLNISRGNRSVDQMYYTVKLAAVYDIKHYERNYGDPSEKLTLASFLSRPLKVIGTNTD